MAKKSNVIWTNLPFVSLNNGLYPDAPNATLVSEMKEHGDFGVGAGAGLAGEVLGLDGVFYQIQGSGLTHIYKDDESISYCKVGFFNSQGSTDLPMNTNLSNLSQMLGPHLKTFNALWGIKIEGTFSAITVRAFDKPSTPLPLWAVLQNENRFDHTNASGTMIGFWTPPFFTEFFGKTEYHFHFVSEDRTWGGHVLSFTSEEVTAYFGRHDGYHVVQPESEAFDHENLSCFVTEDGCTPPP